MTIFGIDISHHQSDINLGSVLGSGEVSFLAAKATEGQGFRDPKYRDYKAAAKAAGTLFAAYHFLRGDSAVVDQANNIVASVGDLSIPVIIDLERTNGVPQPSMADANALRASLRSRGQAVSSLLYLPEWYWNEIGRPSTAGWALWQSDYGSNNGVYPGDDSPRWAAMGRQADVLQYTSLGWVQGYAGDIDKNAFRGTRSELASKGWFIDYRPAEVEPEVTKAEIQEAVRSTPIVVDAAGTEQTLQRVLRRLLAQTMETPEDVARAVVASLPPSQTGLTTADVEQAVITVLTEGTNRP